MTTVGPHCLTWTHPFFLVVSYYHVLIIFDFFLSAMDKENSGSSEVRTILKSLQEGRNVTECLKVNLEII